MKYFVLLGYTVSIILMSCEPAATFTEPQPAGTTSESNFSNKIQGNYWSEELNEGLLIGNQFIISQYNEVEKMHKDSIEEYYKIKGDTLYDLKNGSKKVVEVKSDSIFIYRNYIDTLFSISDKEVLKKWKGYYFLNTKYSDSSWEVKKLWLNKGILTMGEVASLTDLNTLQELTATVGDSTTKPFQLTNKQFKKFVRKDGFRKQRTYKRVIIFN